MPLHYGFVMGVLPERLLLGCSHAAWSNDGLRGQSYWPQTFGTGCKLCCQVFSEVEG